MFDPARQSPSPRRLVVLASAALAASPASAEVPILDGHRYVPSSLVAWSFVDTEVSSTSEAGVTNFVIEPNLGPLTPLLPTRLDGSFISGLQTIAGGYAFNDIVSINASLSASVLLPLETTSSLVIGGHGASGEGIGAAVRLLRLDGFQLTLRADFDAQEVESVILLRLPSSPRVSGDIIGVRPALAAAYTVLPRVGLQGSVTVDWERFDITTVDDVTTLSGAVAATASLDPLPLTVLVGWNVAHEFGRDVSTPTAEAVFGPNRTDYNVEAGFYITTRQELDLGFMFRGEVAGGDHNNRWHGVFRLGYYF